MTDPAAVGVCVAARRLEVSPETVRRWLRDGAPCVRPGGHGPGRAALVNVEALQRWRDGEQGDVMPRVSAALVDVLKRDAGFGEPAHVSLGIDRRRAAALLAAAHERIHYAVTGKPAPELPAEIGRAVCDLPRSRP